MRPMEHGESSDDRVDPGTHSPEPATETEDASVITGTETAAAKAAVALYLTCRLQRFAVLNL
jgi:hypothetical protein